MRQYLYSWDMESGEVLSNISSELLYDISSGTMYMSDIIVMGKNAYIGQSDGLYLLDCDQMSVERIFENKVLSVQSDGEYVWFKGEKGDSGRCIYLIHPENNRLQEIEGSDTATFSAMREGVLYFNGNERIHSFNLSDESYRVLPSDGSSLIYQAYVTAGFFENCMVLRNGYYNYYICLYDMQTGVIERIVPEG